MKQIKKTNRGWRFLSILPLAGLLAVTAGFATPALAAPDLQVRVWVDANSVHKNTNNTYNFTIRGQLKNVGSSNYVSRRNQQGLFLHQVGRSNHITNWNFSRLNRGQVMNVHVPVINQPGGEFIPSYELALSFDPDIYLDRNPANDDRNRRNNQATLSSRRLSAVFARASSGVRGVRIPPVIQRPGISAPVIAPVTTPRRNPKPPKIIPPGLRRKMPDLIPVMRGSKPFKAMFKVKNRGRKSAGPSKLLVKCKSFGFRRPGSGGGCAMNPKLHRYYNASLDGLVFAIPSLRAGQIYTVRPVKGLKWARGKYKFTVSADATRMVSESNERNNRQSTTRRR